MGGRSGAHRLRASADDTAGPTQEFQHHRAWRRAVLEQLCEIDTEADRVIIVPQALLDRAHLAEIVGGLRDDGHRVHHVSLIASPQTLARRLRTRAQGRRSWAYRKIGWSVAALADPEFAVHVSTDDRSIDDTVEAIAAQTGLQLTRDRHHGTRRQMSRLVVQVRHVRVLR